jgi:hypothetical protein
MRTWKGKYLSRSSGSLSCHWLNHYTRAKLAGVCAQWKELTLIIYPTNVCPVMFLYYIEVSKILIDHLL